MYTEKKNLDKGFNKQSDHRQIRKEHKAKKRQHIYRTDP